MQLTYANIKTKVIILSWQRKGVSVYVCLRVSVCYLVGDHLIISPGAARATAGHWDDGRAGERVVCRAELEHRQQRTELTQPGLWSSPFFFLLLGGGGQCSRFSEQGDSSPCLTGVSYSTGFEPKVHTEINQVLNSVKPLYRLTICFNVHTSISLRMHGQYICFILGSMLASLHTETLPRYVLQQWTSNGHYNAVLYPNSEIHE